MGKPLTDTEITDILKYYGERWSIYRISKKIHRSRAVVKRLLNDPSDYLNKKNRGGTAKQMAISKYLIKIEDRQIDEECYADDELSEGASTLVGSEKIPNKIFFKLPVKKHIRKKFEE